MRLVKAKWVQKENGKLTDELADDKYHWFQPQRLIDLPLEIKDKGMAIQQDWIWSNATEQEKRDPNNFRFWYVTKGIFSAPKSYACQYTDHDGNGSKQKLKFKGIPSSALVNGSNLDFEMVQHAYETPGSQIAVL